MPLWFQIKRTEIFICVTKSSMIIYQLSPSFEVESMQIFRRLPRPPPTYLSAVSTHRIVDREAK